MPWLSVDGCQLDVDAVLFDVGGTLLRLDHGFIAERARSLGFAVAAAALAEGEARARRGIDRRAAAEGGVRERDADRLADYFGALLAAAGAADAMARRIAGDLVAAHGRDNLWRVPLPGARETLATLRAQRLRTGAVSNADGRVAQLLERAGLTPHLEVVLDSHLEGVEKPDPEIFHRALARLGVSPARAAYVGDIYAIDSVGARAAGLLPILLDETGSYGAVDCPRIRRLGELAST